VDNPTYDEAIYMVRIKRRHAKAALERIIESRSVIGHHPAPGMDVLLDYFVNMVYGLELLLKVLAKDWDLPGQSQFKHDVGKMYKAVFGHPHADPTFMQQLKDAILDQKYFYEPATGLINRLEMMETLWDELKQEYLRQAWEQTATVQKDVETDEAFGKYLVANVVRFTTLPSYQYDPMTAEQKIAMRRAHIEYLQAEIRQLEAGGSPTPTHDEVVIQLHKQFRSEVERRENMMRMNFRRQGNSKLSFMIWTTGMAACDLG
jgi:hypothetical protein